MTKYLNTKPGSIEEIAVNMSKSQNEAGYQDMFKKELDKAGKGIGSMSPKEKKDFFNKIDSKYKAKDENSKEQVKEAVDNPHAIGMAVAKKKMNDEPPLDKKTIEKAHDIAKSIEKDEKKETHIKTKEVNDKIKDTKGEKETPALPKAESINDSIKSVWQLSAESLEKMKSEAQYMKATRLKQYGTAEEETDVPAGSHKMPDGTIMKDKDHKKEEDAYDKDDEKPSKPKPKKEEKGKADTGSKETKVDVDPKVDYKN